MNTTKAKILLYSLLLLFLAFFYCCKQSETELTDTSDINNSTDSISIIRPPTDYRELCLQNPSYFSADSLYALRQLQLANPFYEEAALQFENDSSYEELIHTLNRLAWSKMILGDKVSAKRFLDRAEKLAETHLSDGKVLWGEIYRTKGNYHSNTGRYNESLKAYEKSLEFMQNVYGKNSVQVAEIYLLIGYLYSWSIMDPYSAIDNYFSSLKILENNKLENEETYILCLYNLAVANRKIGEFNKAEIYTKKMLQNIERKNSAMTKYEEYGYSLLANIYNSLNNYSDAVKYYNKTIELNIKNSTIIDIHLANYYNNMGRIYMEIDSTQKGIVLCKKAIELNNLSIHDSLYLSNSYENLAFGYNQIGQYKIALKYLQMCIKTRRKIYSENHEKTSRAYLSLGEYYAKNGNVDSSIHYLKKSIESVCANFKFHNRFSIPSTESIGENYYLISSISTLADLQMFQYKRTKQLEILCYSKNLYLLCDSLIDLSRIQLELDDSKLRYANDVNRIYENAINTAYLLYKQKNEDEYFNCIFQLMEKNRARILLDNIHSSEIQLKSHIPDSIIKNEKRLCFHIKHLDQLMTEAKFKNDLIRVDSINSILFLYFRESEKLKEYIKLHYPAYFQIQYEFGNHDFATLLSKFPKTTFIEYFSGEHAIYAIKFNKKERLCHKVEMELALEKNLNSIVKKCNTKSGSINDDPVIFARQAYYLYNKLLFPLLKDQAYKPEKQPKTIMIIPDGLLSRLPFEILIQNMPDSIACSFNNLNYLVKNYEIGYSFSCNFLAFMNEESMHKLKNVLAFGYYDDTIDSLFKNKRTSELYSLTGAKKELDAISKYFPGKYISGMDASESNFKNLYAEYDAIHLSVHGTYDSVNNYNTYLIFNANNDSLEDGKLYNYELFPLKLDVDLAVLSACETGLGKENPGEGLLSMGWGFAYAGCKSIVLSLWKTNDRSTAILMGQFYKQLSISNNINTSITEAKRYYLLNADEYTAHPKYWAAFINYGLIKPRGILKNNSKAIFIVFVLSVFLIFISSIIFRKYGRKIKALKYKNNHK